MLAIPACSICPRQFFHVEMNSTIALAANVVSR